MIDNDKSAMSVQNENIEKAWKNAENVRTQQDVLDNETELYRHYDAWGKLLYVGISCSSVSRLGDHMKGCNWRRLVCKITVERWPTRELALIAEKQAIRTEEPYFNRTHAIVLKTWRRPKQKRHLPFCGDRYCSGCK